MNKYATRVTALIDGELQVFAGPVVPGITIADARRYCENHGLGYVGIYRLIQVLASW